MLMHTQDQWCRGGLCISACSVWNSTIILQSSFHSTGRGTCDLAATVWRMQPRPSRRSSKQTHASDLQSERSPREGLSAAADTASRRTTPAPSSGITVRPRTAPVLVGLGLEVGLGVELGVAAPAVLQRGVGGRRPGTFPEMTSCFYWACLRESCR